MNFVNKKSILSQLICKKKTFYYFSGKNSKYNLYKINQSQFYVKNSDKMLQMRNTNDIRYKICCGIPLHTYCFPIF